MRDLFTAAGYGIAAVLALTLATAAADVRAEPTQYPLTLTNCGLSVTFEQAPQRVVSIGQGSTEILLSLGLADRMVGTAVWLGPVLEDYAEENSRIERLADDRPSFESVVGRQPELVTSQFESYVGSEGAVGTREQFAGLGVSTYVSPADCAAKENAGSGDGVRTQPFTMALIYQEILELAQIFDVQERGAALVAELKEREAKAQASVAGARAKGLPVVFWFSSKEVQGEAYVAGRNGAPAYIIETLGARNVMTTEEEWPLVGWETIAGADPAVIVIAEMERRRFDADDPAIKRAFLRSDPVTGELEAVRRDRIVTMDAQSMNPTIRTIDGIEVLAAGIERFGLTN